MIIINDRDHFENGHYLQSAQKINYKSTLEKWQAPNLIVGAVLYLVIGFLFLIFGVAILYQSQLVDQVILQYEALNQCQPQKKKCVLQFNITVDFPAPVFVYYQLNQFYQNNKVYLDSVSQNQILGNTNFKASDCSPVITNSQMKVSKSIVRDSEGNQLPLNGHDVAIPCGLIAQTVFNDTYRLVYINQNNSKQYIPIMFDDISWQYDQNNYKDIDLTKQWISMRDCTKIKRYPILEHFQVWMRAAPTSTFKKLWGRIDQTLYKGEYRLEIRNNFNVIQLQAQKSFILQHLSTLGGYQTVLILGYIFSGIILINMGLFMIYLQKKELNERLNQKME